MGVRKSQLTILFAVIAATSLTACNESKTTSAAGGSSAATSSTSSATSSVKVIFNKKSFYSNFAPNSLGCAGDAKTYYNPLTDLQLSEKPKWLRNISVDVTNSNALNGPSNATSCGLSGLGSSPPANCATFDDLQPLGGATSRNLVVGGYGCLSSTGGCSPTNLLGDVWSLNVPATASASAWAGQAVALKEFPTAS